MTTNKKLLYGILIVVIAILGIGLFFYFTSPGQKIKPTKEGEETIPQTKTDEGKGKTQLPNPAAVYCREQGGKYEIRTGADGGQRGFCLFPDGSECPAWEFYEGEYKSPQDKRTCKKGERFCKDLCGDGICQEIVCQAIGCPCPETPETCPTDCKKGEKLVSFLKEYFNDPNFSPIEVVKGKLDKYLDEEMILVFYKEHGSDKWLIVKEKPEGYVVDKEGEFGDPEGNIFEHFIEARKVISDQPKFFITKSYPRVGTCMPVSNYLNIYRLENEEFKKIWYSQISYTGELTNETGIGTGKVEVIEIDIEFKDLDKDGNSEIIKNGTKKLCKGSCYDCNEIIKEGKIYQIFKWSPQKESFIKAE